MASASRTSPTHPAFRNTARMVARLYDALHDDKRKDEAAAADRHRQRRHDPRLLQGAEDAGGSARRPRRDRRMGAHHLWLDRPLARLQGRVPRDARRQRRLLRSLPGQCAALVQLQPGARAVHQPRHHPSARSIATGRRTRSATSACHVEKETDAGPHRLRREGGRDRLGADQLHLRRPSRPDPGAGQEFRRACSCCRPTRRA